MNFRTNAVGPRGAVVLSIAGVAGIVLAVHGWGNRTATPAGAGLGASASASSPAAPAAGTGTPAPSHSSPAATQGPAAGSSAPGPLLSSQSYAPYAFAVWPGTPSAAAKAAETGLTISVSRRTGGLSVTAGVAGQSAGSPHFYAGGAHVYVIEATLGDDSGGADYNLGDDGIVITDAHGRIVQ